MTEAIMKKTQRNFPKEDWYSYCKRKKYVVSKYPDVQRIVNETFEVQTLDEKQISKALKFCLKILEDVSIDCNNNYEEKKIVYLVSYF
ncbi:21322_t:CDS:2 [Cetraspora pellucida]|uniref:21322_t:CDS:1 n=1 Tax=Cetraspora pellucida TaxID=1433469 RepID=A0A9N9HPE8_9GLOM|nr:21322_t:CDS:2 [Cetraspora pellucida]